MAYDAPIQDILKNARTIAIVGAKDKPGEAVDEVGKYLIRAGYTVIPVHPVRQNVWGLPTYTNLADIPVPIDIVDVFRAPEYCEAHAQEAAALPVRPRVFWMQLGIHSAKAKAVAEAAGMLVVENHCTKIEHAKLKA